uniref:Uncharacterized protein n=1 Tax=Glycine max TaxID=3847 RepID=C6T2G8_SOYBN|nr:unknown [Glycine max]
MQKIVKIVFIKVLSCLHKNTSFLKLGQSNYACLFDEFYTAVVIIVRTKKNLSLPLFPPNFYTVPIS